MLKNPIIYGLCTEKKEKCYIKELKLRKFYFVLKQIEKCSIFVDYSKVCERSLLDNQCSSSSTQIVKYEKFKTTTFSL